MRGRDDRAAANQRSTNPLHLARIRAVRECQARVVPKISGEDRVIPEARTMDLAAVWDDLRVDYLHSEWPPARLN